MKKGNYKTLFWKLSGTVVALVVMLFIATAVSRNFISKHDNSEYSMTKSASVKTHPVISREEMDYKLALNNEFKIVVETGMQVLKESEYSLRDIDTAHLKKIILIESNVVEEMSKAIENIAVHISIPENVKENIIADLEMQLKKNEKNLNKLENRLLDFSYKMIIPQIKSHERSKCKESGIIIEKDTEQDSGQSTDQDIESDPKSNRKNSNKAFYWI